MKKLNLDLDQLRVESFDTTPEGQQKAQGTVFGHGYITPVSCANPTCDFTGCLGDCGSGNTCGGTCGGGTCDGTCGGGTCDGTCGGGTCDGTCGGGTCDGTCGDTCLCPVTAETCQSPSLCDGIFCP